MLRELLIPSVSSLAAAATLGYALLTTSPSRDVDHPAVTPERAAQDFADAYQARDYATAARLAGGSLRRSLELRARRARLQGTRDLAGPRQLVIEESFMLSRERLRFRGVLVPDGAAETHGWPVSITVVRRGDRFFAEALQWPKGAPPDER